MFELAQATQMPDVALIEPIQFTLRGSYFADDNRVGPGAVEPSAAFLHTEKVLLVDGDRRLRGVYNGTERHDVDQLIGDIMRLAGTPGRN